MSANGIGKAILLLLVMVERHLCGAPAIQSQDVRHGQTIYRIYCAVCHGDSGHGDGPMSTIIKVPVPDLTQIAKRNGNVFPLAKVERIIDGSSGLGHGTKEMPIWGAYFGQTGQNRERGRVRIHDVAIYLRTIQQGTPKN